MSTQRTVLAVPRMDCPTEERIIRMALEGLLDQALHLKVTTRRLAERPSGTRWLASALSVRPGPHSSW